MKAPKLYNPAKDQRGTRTQRELVRFYLRGDGAVATPANFGPTLEALAGMVIALNAELDDASDVNEQTRADIAALTQRMPIWVRATEAVDVTDPDQVAQWRTQVVVPVLTGLYSEVPVGFATRVTGRDQFESVKMPGIPEATEQTVSDVSRTYLLFNQLQVEKQIFDDLRGRWKEDIAEQIAKLKKKGSGFLSGVSSAWKIAALGIGAAVVYDVVRKD